MTRQITLDTENFDRMARELAKTSGASYGQAIDELAKKLLDVCVRYTPKAKASEAKRRAEIHAQRKVNRMETSDGRVRVTVNDGSRGGKKGREWVGFKAESERQWYATDIHRSMPDEAWQRAQQLLAARHRNHKQIAATLKRKARESRGLAAKSWVDAGRDLGKSVNAPGFVKKAKPSNGKVYKNGRGSRMTDRKEYVVTIKNDHPTLLKTKGKNSGANILQRAIRARESAHKMELKKKVLDDVEARASRYPGIYSR